MRKPVGSVGELRNRVAASVNTGAETALRGGIDQLVRRNLRGVWVDGELPVGACVWAANHHSWWDFFVAAAALRTTGRRDVGVMMDAANVGRRTLFGQIVVGAQQPRAAVRLVAQGSVLVVFPEGELRAPGPVGTVRPGARWLADRAGVELRVAATRVVLRGQQAPEAYLRVTRPLDPAQDVGSVLATELAAIDGALSDADPMQPLPGFVLTVPGVRSWQERVGALRGGR